jgi:hypothetical protein
VRPTRGSLVVCQPGVTQAGLQRLEERQLLPERSSRGGLGPSASTKVRAQRLVATLRGQRRLGESLVSQTGHFSARLVNETNAMVKQVFERKFAQTLLNPSQAAD